LLLNEVFSNPLHQCKTINFSSCVYVNLTFIIFQGSSCIHNPHRRETIRKSLCQYSESQSESVGSDSYWPRSRTPPSILIWSPRRACHR